MNLFDVRSSLTSFGNVNQYLLFINPVMYKHWTRYSQHSHSSLLVYTGTTSMSCRNFSNFAFARLFVNVSATISPVGQYTTSICFRAMTSRIKWYLTSMCFVFGWSFGFRARAIQPWLSSKTVVGVVCCRPMSWSKCRSHITSCAAEHNEIYSASVDERAVIGCFFDRHEIVPLPRRNTWPEVDFREIEHPAQSESEYPCKTKSLDCVNFSFLRKV